MLFFYRKWLGIERSLDNAVKKHREEKIPQTFRSRYLDNRPLEMGICTKLPINSFRHMLMSAYPAGL